MRLQQLSWCQACLRSNMDWSNAKKYGPLRGIAGEIHGDNSQCQHRGYAVECMKQKNKNCKQIWYRVPVLGISCLTLVWESQHICWNSGCLISIITLIKAKNYGPKIPDFVAYVSCQSLHWAHSSIHWNHKPHCSIAISFYCHASSSVSCQIPSLSTLARRLLTQSQSVQLKLRALTYSCNCKLAIPSILHSSIHCLHKATAFSWWHGAPFVSDQIPSLSTLKQSLITQRHSVQLTIPSWTCSWICKLPTLALSTLE